MTNEQARSLVARLVIAAAVCGGIHAVVAGPLRSKALAAEADLSAFIDRHDMNAVAIADLPRVVEARRKTEAQAGEIAARNRIPRT